MPREKIDPFYRFWTKVEPDDSGCWNWKASILGTGYGSFSDANRRSVLAHRWAYEQVRATTPGLVLDHLCRNRACVNPDHLEEVTHRENLIRGDTINAQQAAKTHCKRGHEFTPENIRVVFRGRVPRPCRQCRACIAMHGRNARQRKLALRT